MLKFIKHHLDTISGVEIYPIISLILFFIVFASMLIVVFKMPKNKIKQFGNLPLDNDLKNNSYE